MDIVSALQVALAQLVGPSAIFYALLAIGLNLHFGYAGLLNFGQIGFALLGGYGVGIMAVNYDQPLWLGAIVGIAAAAVLAMVLGVPTLRLRADYLAIVTIAASEILRLVFRSTSTDEVTHSTNGIYGYSAPFYAQSPFDNGKQYSFLGIKFIGGDLWAMVIGWSIVALLCLMVYLLSHSPWGRVLKAVREDEDAARALGKNAYFFKMQALVLGGCIGALGGVFNSLASPSINPDFFSTAQTFFAYGALSATTATPDGYSGSFDQFLIQVYATVAVFAFSAIGTFILLKVVDVIVGLRVAEDEEREGLDVTQHGERLA